MSSGMRIWGANGALQIDENSFTVRVVYSALINPASEPGRSRYIAIPGVTAATCVGVSLPNGNWSNNASSQDPGNSQFDVQVLDGGIRVWFSNRNFANGRLGVSTQRVLVFRYR